jgi:ApbE superfamily uncharacterized protein (UPF0280 family)
MIEERKYRKQFSKERFRSFTVNYKETDLWIGIDPTSFKKEMEQDAFLKVKELRHQMEQYLLTDPIYGKTFEPRSVQPNAPAIVKIMADAARRAGVGPMAAVAGAFAEAAGRYLLEKYTIKELVIENGGDIFLKVEKPIVLLIYAGSSVLSEKIAIEIPAGETPLGVCTSSGTVGPSVSLGITDATMIVCRNTALADAFATTFGNMVKTAEDIQEAINQTQQFEEILSAVIICQDKIGIRGKFEMKFIR